MIFKEDKSYLIYIRFLLLLSIFFILGIGIYNFTSPTYIYDPLFLRLGIVTILLVFFIFTFIFKKKILKNLDKYFKITFFVTFFWKLYILSINNFEVNQTFLFLVLVTAIFLMLSNLKDLIISGVTFIISTLIALILTKPLINSFILLSSFSIIWLLTYGIYILKKKYIELIRNEQLRNRIITDNMLEMISISDKYGNLIYTNPIHEKIIGYSNDELVGKSVFYYVHPDDLVVLQQLFSSAMNGVMSNKTVQFRYKHKNGSFIWVETVGKVVIEDDIVSGAVFSSREITTKVEQDHKLLESENRFKTLFENSPNAIFLIDYESQEIIDCNDLAAKMNGYNRNEIIGKKISSIQTDDYNQIFNDENLTNYYYDRLNQGETITIIVNHKQKSGNIITIETSFCLVEIKGRKTLLGIDRDITERKKTEKALKDSEEKYRMLFENAPMGIFKSTLSGRFLSVNPAMAKFFGYDNTVDMIYDVKNISNQIYYNPSDRTKLIEEITKREGFYEKEIQFKRKDGRILWGKLVAKALFDDITQQMFISGIIEDISEKRIFENDFNKNLSQLDIIKDTLNCKIGSDFFNEFVINIQKIINANYTYIGEYIHENENKLIRTKILSCNGEIISNIDYSLPNTPCEKVLNENFCVFKNNVDELFPDDKFLNDNKIKGYIGKTLLNSKNEIIGILVSLYENPIQDVNYAENIFQIFSSRAASELERNIIDSELNIYKIQLEDLVENRTRELQSLNIKLESTLEEMQITNERLISEINNRMLLQNALSESEEKYSSFILQSKDAIILTDQRGRVVDCNEAMCGIFEANKYNIINKNYADLIFDLSPDDNKADSLRDSFYQKNKRLNEEIETTNPFVEEQVLQSLISKNKIYVEISTFPILTSRSNYIGRIFRNITEKVLVLEELEKYQNHLEGIIEARTFELKQSEEKIRTLGDNLPGGFIYSGFYDEKGLPHFIYVSRQTEKFFNLSPEDIYERPQDLYNLIYENSDINEVKKKEIRSFKNLDVFDHQVHIINYRGENQWLHLRSLPRFSKEGIIYFDGVCFDITLQKLSELKHLESQENFEKIFNLNPCFIIISKMQDGEILNCNDRFVELLGYSKDKIIGKKSLEIGVIDKETRDLFEDLICKGDIHVKDSSLVNAKGEKIDVRVSVSKSKYFDNDCYIISGFDVSALKTSQKQLKENEKKYRSYYNTFRLLADNSPDLLWAKDMNKNYLFANKALCEMLLITNNVDEPIGRNDFYFASIQRKQNPDIDNWYTFDEIFMNSDEVVMQTKNMQRFEEHGYVNGKLLILDVFKSPVFDDNGVMIGTVGSAREITEQKKKDRALAESERKFRLLAESMTDVVWSMDLNMNYIYISPSIFKQRGFTIDEFMCLKADQIYSPASYKKAIYLFKTEISYALNGTVNNPEHTVIVELEHRCKDGSYIWGEVVVNGLWDEKGKIYGISGITRNIDARKRITLALEESEQKFKMYVENSPIIVLITEINGKIIFANQAATNILEINNNELLEKYLFDLVVGEHIELLKSKFKGLKNRGNASFEFILLKKSLTPINVKVDAVRISEDKFLIFCVDITFIKQAEKSIQRSESMLKQVQNIAKVTYFELDIENQSIVYADNFKNVLGFNINLQLGNDIKEFTSLIDPLNQYEFEKAMENAQKESIKHELSVKLKTNDEKYKCMNVIIEPFNYLNIENNKKIIVTIQDITIQVQNEELQRTVEISEKSAAFKKQFLANMSHEMRTPMTGILGMTEFLLNTDLNPKQLDYAVTIKNSSESLLNILNDVLLLSKIEAGKVNLNCKYFDIKNVLNEMYSLFTALIKQKNLELYIDISKEVPKSLYTDEFRLKQVITNIVSNAVKFTEKGHVNIKVSVDEKTSDYTMIKVEIIDTGIGVLPEKQEVLFQKFSQADASNARNYEGMGLGLFISKEIVTLLGGEISLESKFGAGSNFWFTFKSQNVNYTNSDNELFQNNKTIIKEKLGISVLLVEDKFVNYQVISLMLRNFDCNVDIAKNGQEAIEIYDEGKYDIILMDIQMPVMDGVSAVKFLKQKYNDKLPPIIALTANAMEGDAEKYISLGMDDYMPKPINSDAMYAKLCKWVKKIKTVS